MSNSNEAAAFLARIREDVKTQLANDRQSSAAPASPDQTPTEPESVPEAPKRRTTLAGGGYVADYQLPDGGVMRVTSYDGRLSIDVRDAARRQVLQVSTQAAPAPPRRAYGR